MSQDPTQREIAQRLARLQGPGELRAALLALLRTRGNSRELQEWRKRTQGLLNAESIDTDIGALTAEARLPWFDILVDRFKRHAAGDRQALVEAARGVMAADGKVRPQDRLMWLALRHRLGEGVAPSLSGSSDNDLQRVDEVTALAIVTFTAFLARLVPEPGDSVDAGPAGQLWHAAVVEQCFGERHRAPCSPPQVDPMLRALRLIQGLPWMLRPVLVRAWVDAAFASQPGARLCADAADALRLSCGLLDSPMPPALVRQYIQPDI